MMKRRNPSFPLVNLPPTLPHPCLRAHPIHQPILALKSNKRLFLPSLVENNILDTPWGMVGLEWEQTFFFDFQQKKIIKYSQLKSGWTVIFVLWQENKFYWWYIDLSVHPPICVSVFINIMIFTVIPNLSYIRCTLSNKMRFHKLVRSSYPIQVW